MPVVTNKPTLIAVYRNVVVVIVALVSIFSVGCSLKSQISGSPQPISTITDPATLEALYREAIIDSMVVEKHELYPVVAVTRDNPAVTWNEAGNRILLVTFHGTPDKYPAGQDVHSINGDVWTFCEKEAIAWYGVHGTGIKNKALRFNQLIGSPVDTGYTHVSGFWVSPDDVIRPAYVTDITKGEMDDKFDGKESPDYHKWFNDNIIGSYYEGSPLYPWTRIGYTYDWGSDGSKQGLSEFLVKKGADIRVEFTMDIESFSSRLAGK